MPQQQRVVAVFCALGPSVVTLYPALYPCRLPPTCVVRGHALSGSFCQNLPFAQREVAWQQRAP